MKRTTRQSVDVLGTLLSERRKYEQWIAALEAKKDQTPKSVYERVHGDYSSRLKHVMDELSARSAELDGQREGLRSRVEELERDELAKRDERAEAELRHAVGEYTPEQWDELVRDSEQTLMKLGAERARLAAELESLERVLGGLGATIEEPPPPPELPTATPAAAAPSVPAAATGAAAKPAGKPTPRDVGRATPAKSGESFDELAFLKSVVPEGQAPKADGAAAPASDAAKRATPAGSAPAKGDGKERAEAGKPDAAKADKVAPGGKEVPPISMPDSSPSLSASSDAPTTTDAAPGESAVPVRSSRVMTKDGVGAGGIENLGEKKSDAPTFLKNVPQEPQKSLKCGECGAMNYATEWYCERCGAELAAL